MALNTLLDTRMVLYNNISVLYTFSPQYAKQIQSASDVTQWPNCEKGGRPQTGNQMSPTKVLCAAVSITSWMLKMVGQADVREFPLSFQGFCCVYLYQGEGGLRLKWDTLETIRNCTNHLKLYAFKIKIRMGYPNVQLKRVDQIVWGFALYHVYHIIDVWRLKM